LNCKLTSTDSPWEIGWVRDIRATDNRAVPGDRSVAAGTVVEPTGRVLFDSADGVALEAGLGAAVPLTDACGNPGPVALAEAVNSSSGCEAVFVTLNWM
jgi:hypothetical protein